MTKSEKPEPTPAIEVTLKRRSPEELKAAVRSVAFAVLSKYGGGLPHADLAETARLLETMGIKTAVMVSDVSRDRRVESALLFNVPEVDAIVYNGGNGTAWDVPKADRVIAATAEFTELLKGPMKIDAANVVGVTNQQGASRMRAMVY